MLSREDDEATTRVGPGTVMGNLFRQYWLPSMLSSELPEPDGDQVRVKLLGEELIGFRDTDGRVGLLQNLCPHRAASLFYARNEDCGLRCVYHGWKFDVTGQCTDMPSEPPESNFKEKVKAQAYPCVERGGVVWTYMGSREVPPPLPDIEANQLPEGEYEVSATLRECNWLQALEGDIDTSHFGFLHYGATAPEDAKPGTFLYYSVKDRGPRYALVDTEYGSMYGAYRPAGPDELYWRIAQHLFPCYTHIPSGALGHQVLTRAWVPMDDDHTMFVSMGARSGRPFAMRTGEVPRRSGVEPNGTGWYERFRPITTGSNDYLIDRESQRRDSYTGIEGVPTQDQAVTESMGSVLDRSKERLGSSDVMVIRVRHRLLEAARALADKGVVPPGVEDPGVYATRSGSVVLPEGADWIEATDGLRRAYVEHPELDLSLEAR